jgi:hypothetical protein
MYKILILFSTIYLLAACKGKTADESITVDANEVTSDTLAPIMTDTIPDTTARESLPTAPDDKKTTIYFPRDSYNFGQITEGEVVSYTFSFTNSGDETLVIHSAKGSCGCTVPKYSKKPIQPGESGLIEVSFDSRDRVGPNTKGVFIESNTDPTLTILKISAEVMPKPDKKKGKSKVTDSAGVEKAK